MIDKVCDYKKCTGCSACMNACPTSSIVMVPGEIGHIFPEIAETCIDCMKCVKTCPVNNIQALQLPSKTLAFWVKDDTEHKTSTSGGAAACFSNYIIENNGVVYGCASLSHGIIEHIRIDKIEDAKKLKGSKYVQSNINYTYRAIKDDLANNRKVLFVGLPCQVAGLKSYIGKRDNNLYTIDLICHGVPSQKVLFEYIESLGIKRDEIEVVTFRESKGYYLSIKSTGRNLYRKNEYSDLYFMAFNDNLCFRDSCFSCRYSTKERIGDITIGDFWGLGARDSFDYDTHGNVSVVLINNLKGQELIDACSGKYESVERSLEEAVAGNHNLKAPSISTHNARFKKLYGKVPIQNIFKICCWKRRMKAPFIPMVNYLMSIIR